MILKSKKEQTLFDISNTEGLIESIFTVEVIRVAYDWIKDVANIELSIKEDKSKYDHVRSIEIIAENELTVSDIKSEVLNYFGDNFEVL